MAERTRIDFKPDCAKQPGAYVTASIVPLGRVSRVQCSGPNTDRDGFRTELYEPGCFRSAELAPGSVRLVLEHDPGGVELGQGVKFEERNHELQGTFRLHDTTAAGQWWWLLHELHPQVSRLLLDTYPSQRRADGVQVYSRAALANVAVMARGQGAYGDRARVLNTWTSPGWRPPAAARAPYLSRALSAFRLPPGYGSRWMTRN
jgi:hypothetical protein